MDRPDVSEQETPTFRLPPGERQRLLEDFDVDHDVLRQALGFTRRFHMPVDGGHPDHGRLGILAGDSRTGKTHSVLRYVRSFPTSEGEGGKVFPAIYIETPGIGGERALLEATADALELPYNMRTKSYELLNNILRGLRDHKVDLIIIDEFQDVFDAKKQQLLKAVRKILRKILNLKPCAPNILCVGLEETYDLMRSDRQLTGRGGLPYKIIRPYGWDTAEGRESFRLLCGVIDKTLPFEKRAGLYSEKMAERLYFVTQGSIGRLKNFLFSAGTLAINEGATRIALEHLARAYDEQKPPGVSFNAFTDDLSHAPKNTSEEPSHLRDLSMSQLMSKTARRRAPSDEAQLC